MTRGGCYHTTSMLGKIIPNHFESTHMSMELATHFVLSCGTASIWAFKKKKKRIDKVDKMRVPKVRL